MHSKPIPFSTFYEPDELERMMRQAKEKGIDCKLEGPVEGDEKVSQRSIFVTRNELMFYFIDDYNDHAGLTIVPGGRPQ